MGVTRDSISHRRLTLLAYQARESASKSTAAAPGTPEAEREVALAFVHFLSGWISGGDRDDAIAFARALGFEHVERGLQDLKRGVRQRQSPVAEAR